MSPFSFGVFKDAAGYFVRDENGTETRQPNHATAVRVVRKMMTEN